MKVTKNKKGRPRVSPNSIRMTITISQDDSELLECLAVHSSSRPATLVRELIIEARPTMIAMVEAMDAYKSNSQPPADSLAFKMLKYAISDVDPTQMEILDLLNENKKSKK